MSFKEVRDMPVRAFWLMAQMIDRVRAEEILEWLPAHSSAMGGEGVTKLANALEERMGRPVISEQIKASKADLEKARRLFGTG